jgi:hypothetical protein
MRAVARGDVHGGDTDTLLHGLEDVGLHEQQIIILMRATYGEQSQLVIRAEETAAALQRLKWALERTQQRRQAARARGC